jgi:hypothetical protein
MMVAVNEWSVQQWAGVDLGDRRRTARAVEIGAKMAARPEASLPCQMQSAGALKGAYRLLNEPDVTLSALLEPHRQQTLAAARRCAWALMVEDTTELDYTAHPSKTGLGPIGDGRGQGLLLHSTLAVDPDLQAVLGLAHAQVVIREAAPTPRPKWTRSPEAWVWQVSAQQVGSPPPGVRWVHVADRGADSFAYLAECRRQNKDFLIRIYRNRELMWEPDEPQALVAEAHALLTYARSLPAAGDGQQSVTVRATKDHPARVAQVVLAWAEVTVTPSKQGPPDLRAEEPLACWVLRVWEVDAPPNVEPLEWLLLTSVPIPDLATAHQLVNWYTCRWLCEDFHQCLKTGCHVEDSQLDDRADLERLLGFAIPIAVRLLQLRQVVRQSPQLPATAVVEPLLVEILVRLRPKLQRSLLIIDFWHQVARLGGHQGRRRDGEPGWRTLWRGYRYLSDLAEGARLFTTPSAT